MYPMPMATRRQIGCRRRLSTIGRISIKRISNHISVLCASRLSANNMKKFLYVFAIISTTATMLPSCMTKTARSNLQIDSSLYLNDKIQLGDTAMSLVGKGVLVPDTDNEEYFDLTNKTFAGVIFDKARAVTKDERIKCLLYVSESYDNKDDFQKEKNKLFVYLCKEYGKPSKDSSYVEKDEAPDSYAHDYTWERKTRIVSVTIRRNEWPYWLGGCKTYNSFVLVTIQDSILQRKNLQSLSVK